MKTRINSSIKLPEMIFMVLYMLLFNITFGQIKEGANDKTLSPYFFINSKDPGLDKLPLKNTSADVNIAGVIADVVIKQTYKNEGAKPIEAIYIFPGSSRAAVYKMKMTIGERTIIAKIKEKEQARQAYENARKEGKTASLLEQQRPNVFQMNVANILPGDIIKVEMAYTELLVPEEGIYEFVYPTVVGPRYSDQPAALASTNEKWIENPYTQEGEKPFYTFNLTASINTGIPIKEIVCTTHDVNVKYNGSSSAMIKLKETEKFGGNRDYILKYRLRGSRIESGLLLYEGENENYFLLMMQPPKRVTADQIPPREYIFIVDVSGSMHGFPLDISKKLLRDLIGKLRPIDKFNVLLFASASTVMSEQSLPATKENINKAINVISNQRGGGGTRLLPALQRALNLPGIEDVSRTVVIATDGYVAVEKEAFDLIRKNLSNANFFSFGIGSSVNRYIIEGMAHVGMGEPFIVTHTTEANVKATKFRQYIQSPVLTNINLDFEGLDVYDMEPVTIPDVMAERPVIVFGKYRGTPGGKIKLKGLAGSKHYIETIDVRKTKPEKKNAAIRNLWARHRIKILDDYNNLQGNRELVEEITNIGLEYNLLTAYTSFIAIDSEIRNEGGVTTIKQPLPLPQGVSNYAVGNAAHSSAKRALNPPGGLYMTEPVSDRSMNARGSLIELEEEMIVNSKIDHKEVKKKVFKEKDVDITPHFPGGISKMHEFIKTHLKYPKAAKDSGIQGSVYVSFIVDDDGKLRDIRVIRSLSKELDVEAVRLIKLMPAWITGKKNGKSVAVKITLPVKFKI